MAAAADHKVKDLSLATRKPTPEMLMDVDVLIYDIQDIGVRQYTYESTMALAMQAACGVGDYLAPSCC